MDQGWDNLDNFYSPLSDQQHLQHLDSYSKVNSGTNTQQNNYYESSYAQSDSKRERDLNHKPQTAMLRSSQSQKSYSLPKIESPKQKQYLQTQESYKFSKMSEIFTKMSCQKMQAIQLITSPNLTTQANQFKIPQTNYPHNSFQMSLSQKLTDKTQVILSPNQSKVNKIQQIHSQKLQEQNVIKQIEVLLRKQTRKSISPQILQKSFCTLNGTNQIPYLFPGSQALPKKSLTTHIQNPYNHPSTNSLTMLQKTCSTINLFCPNQNKYNSDINLINRIKKFNARTMFKSNNYKS